MKKVLGLIIASSALSFGGAHADENLFGYVKGAETLPKGTKEIYVVNTMRNDKGVGTYKAFDTNIEYEYGVTDKFTAAFELKLQSLDTKNLVLDAYIPGDKKTTLKPSGFGISGKYRFLSAAIDPIGLSAIATYEYSGIDKHSGTAKKSHEMLFGIQGQKYFMEGQGVLAVNASVFIGHEHRDPLDKILSASQIAALPEGFEWPDVAEMEIEPAFGVGYTYRFAPNWFIGAESVYSVEYETEVDVERWSVFAGPSLHYGGEKFWGTLTWFHQLRGGGGENANNVLPKLHLVEKTKDEIRLKVGYNF